jgi:hypothetical protein
MVPFQFDFSGISAIKNQGIPMSIPGNQYIMSGRDDFSFPHGCGIDKKWFPVNIYSLDRNHFPGSDKRVLGESVWTEKEVETREQD